MRSGQTRAWSTLFVLAALAGCHNCNGHDGTSCSVAQVDAGVSIACGDGSDATIPTPEPCSVSQTEDAIIFTCPDGSSVTVPIDGEDTGDESCTVTENDDGSSTIHCPDGSSAVIPAPAADAGVDGGALSLVHLTGATTMACGGCHDSDANKTHYVAMTAWVDGKPVEDCGSCHKESGIEAVSAKHARPELGPPGFKVDILGASIDPTTRRATVQLSIQDDAGNPLTRNGVSSNFLIARVPTETPVGGTTPVAGAYTSYITRTVTQLDNPDFPLEGEPRVVQQPTGESNGTFTNPRGVDLILSTGGADHA